MIQLLDDRLYRMRDAFARLGAFACLSDDLKFVGVTDSFTALLGYTSDELEGRNVNHIALGDHSELQVHQMLRHLYKGGTWINDLLCQHKDGSPVEIRVSVSPSIRDGVIVGFLAQYQRTLLQHNQAGLSDVLYRYREGFARIAALAIVKTSGEVLEVNDLFVDLFGYLRDEIVGKHINVLSRQPEDSKLHQEVWDIVSTGRVYTGETEGFSKDGARLSVRMTVAPASNVNIGAMANFDAFLVILQDVTQESMIREANQELAIESMRQQMLRGVLHNISNLQQGILAANSRTMTSAQGLDQACVVAMEHYKALTDQVQKGQFLNAMSGIVINAAREIKTSAEEERQAIESTVAILETFRREQRNVMVTTQDSLRSVVQRVLSTFSLSAAEHRIAVSLSAIEDANVRWQISKVHQILINLLTNAQQALAEEIRKGELHQHRGRIDMAIRVDNQMVSIVITDNGGGFNVPPEQLFRPNFTTKANGCGIGLHASAIMAQDMGGSLDAANTQALGRRGAAFTLRLPIDISAAQ